MIRRNARLRREFIYSKSLEGKEKIAYERKMKVKKAIEEGKAIPTELRDVESKLRQEIEYEDAKTSQVKSHMDDEYARAGLTDPRVLITTSREPSSKLVQFAKEMKLIFPNSQRMNRGSYVIKEIMDACRSGDVTDLIVLHEHRGKPDGMVVCHLPYGPTAFFSLSDCVMRHDVPDMTQMAQVFPHLIFNNFNSKLGERVSNILKYLFPVPKLDSQRIITFANDSDVITFRHHTYTKTGGKKIELDEIGPRFDMRLFKIKLGTLDQPDAETEYVMSPYTNTAKFHTAL